VAGIQPQGQDFSYVELCLRWYEAARRCGVDIDIVPPGAPLAGYAAVLTPCLPIVSEAARAAYEAADGMLLFGPRTGSKTQAFAIPPELPPGPLQALLPLRVVQVASLRPGLRHAVTGRVAGAMERWREWVEPGTGTEAMARFADGTPALLRAGPVHYFAGWPDAALLDAAMRHVLDAAGLALMDLPPGVRLRRRSGTAFAFNYGPEPWTAPDAGRFVLGARRAAAGLGRLASLIELKGSTSDARRFLIAAG
jgi:beta-galactosidase